MRILVADHHPQTLWAFKTRLLEEPGMTVMGEAGDCKTLLELSRVQPIDVVLIDGELPGLPVDMLIRQLHSLTPRPKVIVMSSNPEFGRKYLKAGAEAFVSKTDQPDWLFETLRHLSGLPSQEPNHA